MPSELDRWQVGKGLSPLFRPVWFVVAGEFSGGEGFRVVHNNSWDQQAYGGSHYIPVHTLSTVHQVVQDNNAAR